MYEYVPNGTGGAGSDSVLTHARIPYTVPFWNCAGTSNCRVLRPDRKHRVVQSKQSALASTRTVSHPIMPRGGGVHRVRVRTCEWQGDGIGRPWDAEGCRSEIGKAVRCALALGVCAGTEAETGGEVVGWGGDGWILRKGSTAGTGEEELGWRICEGLLVGLGIREFGRVGRVGQSYTE